MARNLLKNTEARTLPLPTGTTRGRLGRDMGTCS
jgi:hypothetical protein